MATTRRYSEKLHSAIYALAVREGDVRSRLEGAYFYLRQLSERDVPATAREEFFYLVNALTRAGPDRSPDGEVYRSAVSNTLRNIQNRTARRYAERLFALYRELR